MKNEPVGISILTNGARLNYLRACIDSLLAFCYYRPLHIGICDNGSTDGTNAFVSSLPDIYGVKWFCIQVEEDMGCSIGTNLACELTRDCKYTIHLESDFIHIHPDESGLDKMWLHRAVEFMDSGECDYLYLRRMRDQNEMMMHFWSQWMPQVTEKRGEYLKCPPFWFSQNPHLRNNEALYSAGTLPMPEFDNDNKDNMDVWNKAEMSSAKPPNTWIHQWGMFVHERDFVGTEYQNIRGCGNFPQIGRSTCKYGFYVDGKERFCQHCDLSKGMEDMPEHEARYRKSYG
jgi:glycosyltransferase involved in cell wall biosynthesis